MRTLPKEPFRGGQICGYQIEYGTGRSVHCGERKADRRYFCPEHHEDVRDTYGRIRMAPGNARGDFGVAVQLLWEPYEGDAPLEPSADERAAYAAA